MTTVEELKERAISQYLNNFKSTDPEVVAVAPGRVNLIGEHVDYCNGFVMPMAIPLYTVIVAGRSTGNDSVRIISLNAPGANNTEMVSLPLTQQTVDSNSSTTWTNYIRGVLAQFVDVPAFDCVIASTVPLGGGLSSSAALEVAMYALCEQLTGKHVSPVDRALACQKAEHDFAGMPCGIMDQFVVSQAKAGHALLIDCRSLESELVPMPDSSYCVLVMNSNVKHELTGSEYPQRRQACEQAAQLLGVNSLRDIDQATFDEKQAKLADEVMRRRARHVVGEIERTVKAAECLKKGQINEFGVLMQQSHKSLRDDFEVSCPEVDELVELATSCPNVKVFGSRMTGGGFGGCTVTLCRSDDAQIITDHVKAHYKGNATFYICEAVDGAKAFHI